MIKNIYSTGKYIQVLGGAAPNTYAGSLDHNDPPLRIGDVRFNSSGQNFEVCNGTSWIPFQTGVAGVELTGRAESILDWAYTKMMEEAELERLSKENPAVSIAVENLNRAKEQLKTTIILSRENEKTTS